MQSLIKQPAETLKRKLDFAGAGAILQLVDVSAEARGLVVGSAPLAVVGSLTAGMLFVEMDGGTDGERYLITARGETADGETREAEMEVTVLDGAWTMPDGGTPYLSIAEFVARFGLEETIRMTDGDGSGRIDRDYLTNALSAAQAIADVHIAARYVVPLVTVPEIVKLSIGDMARARLYPNGVPESVGDAAKAAARMMERIGQGSLPLPALEPIAAAPTTAPILIKQGERRYGGDALDGY